MIAIIDYEAGNLTSVKRALDFLGRGSVITRDFSRITSAERVIFPGVGAAGKAMSHIREGKLDKALAAALAAGTPILGICLGTQVIMEHSRENDTTCLGLIGGDVRRFPEDLTDPEGRLLKVPHMGWNGLKLRVRHPLFEGVDPESEFYFVHSYYPAPADPATVLAETSYGISFASALGKENLVAVQFHPEKSGNPGLKILSNFCNWNGS
ncbi:MAG: imidazole glycerol phosphate synthase subunit HisH [Deltaproteobacteria bacterium]|nr:imidazole glycerol phosphate synthase subunit HisH [Deltaproteobacteria bacterium]